MLSAFLAQSKINDSDADKLESDIAAFQKYNFDKASENFGIETRIAQHVSIPSKLADGQLDQKPNIHNNFKEYDHSLEKVRRKFPSITLKNTSDPNVGSVGEVSQNMFDGSGDVD